MRPRIDPDRHLLRLAELQAGALGRDQALRLGLTRHSIARLLAEGRWQRLAGGLYFLGHGEPGWLAQAWGGVLLAGDRARLGQEAAAHLYGLLETPPRSIAVWAPHGSRLATRPPWRFLQERPGLRNGSVGAPPRTSVEDTVLDLCPGAAPEAVVGLVTSAVQTGRTTVARLRRRLEARPAVGHRPLLVELLADVADGAESPLELRYLRDVERRHGLPRGRRQQVIRTGERCDVAYDLGVVVELDGRVGHGGDGRFRDMARDNRNTSDGLVTLRYGYQDVVGQPCAVAQQVAAVLNARGWPGTARRCAWCRQVSDFG